MNELMMLSPLTLTSWTPGRHEIELPECARVVAARTDGVMPHLIVIRPQRSQTLEYKRRQVIVATPYSLFEASDQETLRYIGTAHNADGLVHYFFEVHHETPIASPPSFNDQR